MSQTLIGVHSEIASKLISSIEELLAKKSHESLSFYDDELQALCSRVKSARIGYPFLLEERHPQLIDRLGNVLLGPIFTSNLHPWPFDEDAKPMAPLCQINTAQIPQALQGVEGLVQVWLLQSKGSIGDALIRVIPFADADASLLSPVIPHGEPLETLLPDAADWLRDFHCDPKPSRKQYISAAAEKLGYVSADALSDANWDEWIRLAEEYGDKHGDDFEVCWQIAGFKEGNLYCDVTEDQKGAIADLLKAKKKLEKNPTAPNAQDISLLTSVGDAYKAWIEVCGEMVYPCLFGAFSEIQYSGEERNPPYICFESIGTRDWGDGGNAQVFYDKNTGFSFDWSCT